MGTLPPPKKKKRHSPKMVASCRFPWNKCGFLLVSFEQLRVLFVSLAKMRFSVGLFLVKLLENGVGPSK